jgi:hypothetical protein
VDELRALKAVPQVQTVSLLRVVRSKVGRHRLEPDGEPAVFAPQALLGPRDAPLGLQDE